ncbi:MAG: hypothetical protein HYS12_14110 [Planctomycetes bacterium]|nr:hypothetical protein [Planctomycetota bacterium]
MSRSRLTVLCLLAGLAGCMEGTKGDPLQRESLATRLGETKVDQIVADFIASLKEDRGLDPELKRKFEGQDTGTLQKQLKERIFPSKSRDLTAHDPLPLTSKDFAALAPDLNKALKKNEVSDEERKELLDLLAPSRCRTLE